MRIKCTSLVYTVAHINPGSQTTELNFANLEDAVMYCNGLDNVKDLACIISGKSEYSVEYYESEEDDNANDSESTTIIKI